MVVFKTAHEADVQIVAKISELNADGAILTLYGFIILAMEWFRPACLIPNRTMVADAAFYLVCHVHEGKNIVSFA